nr:HD domain-containing phosphohydrolase [Sedimentibacter sp.]
MQIVNNIRLIKHSIKVAIFSYNFAKKINLSKEQCRNIFMAGLLHDIGKLKLDQSILNKKSKLSEEEFEYIKLHVNLGVQILKKYKVSESIYRIVEQHHESEDGTGYPNGFKGDYILIESKILRTADIYDALTSNRSYRKKYSSRKAIEIMIKENKI